jgi:sortase A
MTRKRPEDLSLQEIRFLLVEKRRAWRHVRLQHFQRTQRVTPFLNEWNTFDVLDNGSSNGRNRSQPVRVPHRTWLGYLLLVLEFLAVTGIIAIVVSSLSTLDIINRSVSAALIQPTLEPTPMIQAVVLPDGHTPPNRPGGAKPNEAEIPVHLRPVWQSLSNLPIPMPVIEQAIRIQIPAIGVDAPVIQGDGWEQLKKGVAQHIDTPNPGQRGNIVLSGHNDIYGEIFRIVTEGYRWALAYSKNLSKTSLADFIRQHRLEHFRNLLRTVLQPFASVQQIETCLQDVFSVSPWAIA